MTKDQKLNRLATLAGKGCKDSIEDLCRHYLPYITEISERYKNRLSSETSFECTCLKMIERTIEEFDKSKGNFDRLVRSSIYNLTRVYLARGSRRLEKLLSINRDDENGEGDGVSIHELQDHTEDVAGKVNVKEMIAFLAEGDPRKEMILRCWSDGLTNDTKLSELLAQQFGGKARSHCKFIQRFRDRCRLLWLKTGQAYYPNIL